MALAALSAAAVFDVPSATAEAAPTASPFAGTYLGGDPRGWVSQWTVTVSDGGRITGVRSGFSRDKISGQVSADGAYSLSVAATIWVFAHKRGNSVYDPELELRTESYKSVGSMAPDGYGNVVGTDSTGGSFFWLRQ
jgi:hypothetical protein